MGLGGAGQLYTVYVSLSVCAPWLLSHLPFRGLTAACKGTQGGSGRNEILTPWLNVGILLLPGLMREKVVLGAPLLPASSSPSSF